MPKLESEFPTISDLHDAFASLVKRGLGRLPAQVVVVPDSTLQAIAKAGRNPSGDSPALMVELRGNTGRIPVTIVSTSRLSGSGMPAIAPQ